jgi:hypothetical protein
MEILEACTKVIRADREMYTKATHAVKYKTSIYRKITSWFGDARFDKDL